MKRDNTAHFNLALAVLVFAGVVIALQLFVPAGLIAFGHTELVDQLGTTINGLASLVTFCVGGVIGYFFNQTRR